jgi:serine/threonine-protein kinase
LNGIILRCLAKKPDERFADIADVDRALAECAAALEWSEDRADAWWRESVERDPNSSGDSASRESQRTEEVPRLESDVFSSSR